MELEADGLHFTPRGFRVFERRFAKAVRSVVGPHAPVVILTDSTVGHRSSWADRLARRIGKCHVDAVCGSGFLAGREDGQHFGARLSKYENVAIVVCGGWNDVSHDEEQLLRAAARFARRCHTRTRGAVSI